MFTGRSIEPLRGPVAHGTTYDQLEHNTMQHSLVYASKSTLPSNEANAVHVVQMCDAFASQLQTVVRSEEHTSELQSLMRSSYAVFCLNKKYQKPLQKDKTN